MFRLNRVGSIPARGVLALCLALLCCGSAWALGTPAGTTITGTATVTYTLESEPAVQTASAACSFTVLEVIDLAVTWQDAAPVAAASPQAGRELSFLLANTGNGPETFGLTAEDALAGDDFDPAFHSLWFETNGIDGLQTGGAVPDTLYQPGLNDPELPADAVVLVYLVSDIPAGLTDGDLGNARLLVEALTPGAAGAPPGTLLAGAGLNGVDAVVGAAGAQGQAVGSYTIAALEVTLTKSIVRIADRFGGSEPQTGAAVTYRIVVQVSGGGTAEALVVRDPIPADMTYVPGSLLLNGAAQTDADDAPVDHSDFNATAPGAVSVNLGDTAAPAVHVIEFATIIN